MGRKRTKEEADDGNGGSADSKIKRRRLGPEQLRKLEDHFQKDIYPSTQVKYSFFNVPTLKKI